MGAGIVIFGMYLLMWGKEEAQTNSAGRYLSYKDSTGLKPETDGDQMTTEPWIQAYKSDCHANAIKMKIRKEHVLEMKCKKYEMKI